MPNRITAEELAGLRLDDLGRRRHNLLHAHAVRLTAISMVIAVAAGGCRSRDSVPALQLSKQRGAVHRRSLIPMSGLGGFALVASGPVLPGSAVEYKFVPTAESSEVDVILLSPARCSDDAIAFGQCGVTVGQVGSGQFVPGKADTLPDDGDYEINGVTLGELVDWLQASFAADRSAPKSRACTAAAKAMWPDRREDVYQKAGTEICRMADLVYVTPLVATSMRSIGPSSPK